MLGQIPPERLTQDAETLDEAYEAQRVNSLPPSLQALALAHHQDQFHAIPSYVERQAADFVALCDAQGIQSEKE